MKLDPNRSYMPSETLGKFYYEISTISLTKIYQYHIERWNPMGNIAIETTLKNPEDVNLVVGLLVGYKDEIKGPKKIATSKVPDSIKKAILIFVLENLAKRLKEFKD